MAYTRPVKLSGGLDKIRTVPFKLVLGSELLDLKVIIKISHSMYRLHTEVQVSMQFTPPRAAGPRWCKKHRDRTRQPKCVTDLYTMAQGHNNDVIVTP